MKIVDMHPPISRPKVIHHPDVPGEYLLNVAACIRIAKEGETPKAQALYRTYTAQYRALEGEQLSHDEREQKAWWAAAELHGWTRTPLT